VCWYQQSAANRLQLPARPKQGRQLPPRYLTIDLTCKGL
jgi:hypothetical protein